MIYSGDLVVYKCYFCQKEAKWRDVCCGFIMLEWVKPSNWPR